MQDWNFDVSSSDVRSMRHQLASTIESLFSSVRTALPAVALDLPELTPGVVTSTQTTVLSIPGIEPDHSDSVPISCAESEPMGISDNTLNEQQQADVALIVAVQQCGRNWAQIQASDPLCRTQDTESLRSRFRMLTGARSKSRQVSKLKIQAALGILARYDNLYPAVYRRFNQMSQQ